MTSQQLSPSPSGQSNHQKDFSDLSPMQTAQTTQTSESMSTQPINSMQTTQTMQPMQPMQPMSGQMSEPIPQQTLSVAPLHTNDHWQRPLPQSTSDHEGSLMSAAYLPTTAHSGLQYTAMASLTFSDSILRGLPSLDLVAPDFRLVQRQDPTISAWLTEISASQDAYNFQSEYIAGLVASSNIDGLTFHDDTQMASSTGATIPQLDLSLSPLAESILNQCTGQKSSSHLQLQSDESYQLPKIDPIDALIQFRNDFQAAAAAAAAAAADDASIQTSKLIHGTPPTDTLFTTNQKPGSSLPSHADNVSEDLQDAFTSHQSQLPTLLLQQLNDDFVCEVGYESMSIATSQKRNIHDMSDGGDEQHPLSDQMLQSTPKKIKSEHPNSDAVTDSAESIQPLQSFLETSSSSSQHHPSLKFSRLAEVVIPVSGKAFEDKVAELLEWPSGADQILYDASKALSPLEAKHLGRTISDLSRQGLLGDVQIDTLTVLLKYLDSYMSHHSAQDILSQVQNAFMPSDEERVENSAHGSNQAEDREGVALRLLGSICTSLEHISLSLIILNGQGIQQQQLYPEDLLINSLSVFKAHVEDFLTPALEFSKDDGRDDEASTAINKDSPNNSDSAFKKTTKLKSLFHAITGRADLKARVLSLVAITCDISERLRLSRSTELSDSVVVKLVYIALSLFFIDTSSEAIVRGSDAESLKIAGTNLLRMTLEGVKSVNDGATTSVGYIFNFLLSRCTKGTKSSVETEYRTLAKLLDDPKADLTSRTMAVDSLGLIASRIKTISIQLSAEAQELAKAAKGDTAPYLYYGEIGAETKMTDMLSLQESFNKIFEYLSSHESSDAATKASKNVWICQWVSLLCINTTKKIEKESDGQSVDWEKERWSFLMEQVKSVLQSAAYLTSRLSLFMSFDMLLTRILSMLESGTVILRTKALKALSLVVTKDHEVLAQAKVRKTIALRLQDQSPAVRDAAVELVGKYMVQDNRILKAYYDIVSDRISDTGLNVRKRVIRLLKDLYYQAENGTMRTDIAHKLLLRVNDSETTVRELAVKCVSDVLFAPFISTTTTTSASGAFPLSSADRTIPQETLSASGQATTTGSAFASNATASVSSSQKREVSKRARGLVDIVGKLTVNQDDAFGSVVRALLQKENERIGNSNTGSSHIQPEQAFTVSGHDFRRAFAVIVDCLVDLVQTLQDEGASKQAVTATIHALYTFIKAEPLLIQSRHLGGLLVYLHCSNTSDDWRITMFVLKIFQHALRVMRDVPSHDAEMAEKLLLTLVAKCPVVLLPEAVEVLCQIVHRLGLHSGRLCKFFQTCVDLLEMDLKRLLRSKAEEKAGQLEMSVNTDNKTRRLTTIVGLMCRFYTFDSAIEAEEERCKRDPDTKVLTHLYEMKQKMLPTVHEYVYGVLNLYNSGASSIMRQTALQSLGFIFLSFPKLMTSTESINIMDGCFAGQDNELKTELLTILANYLQKIQITPAASSIVTTATASLSSLSIDKKALNANPKVNLIAKADDHFEAGIGSSITQRFLNRVLACALTTDRQLQAAAVEVISQTTSQALAHPIICMPVVIALGTSEDRVLRSRMFVIHEELHRKYASLIYSKCMECIRTMYLYQRSAQGGTAETKGYTMVVDAANALINPMYALMGEKRQQRNALLSALVKVLDVDLSSPSIEVDGNYARFIAENLAYLEYRTMEEVFLVLFYLNRIIAGTGMTLLESTAELAPSATRGTTNGTRSVERETVLPQRALAKASVPLEMAMILKLYLKRMYDLSETKCQQFQPSAHATHKEKPTRRAAHGELAKIHWQCKSIETEMLCRKDGDEIKEASDYLVRLQLARFRELIEAETVQRIHDEGIIVPSGQASRRPQSQQRHQPQRQQKRPNITIEVQSRRSVSVEEDEDDYTDSVAADQDTQHDSAHQPQQQQQQQQRHQQQRRSQIHQGYQHQKIQPEQPSSASAPDPSFDASSSSSLLGLHKMNSVDFRPDELGRAAIVATVDDQDKLLEGGEYGRQASFLLRPDAKVAETEKGKGHSDQGSSAHVRDTKNKGRDANLRQKGARRDQLKEKVLGQGEQQGNSDRAGDKVEEQHDNEDEEEDYYDNEDGDYYDDEDGDGDAIQGDEDLDSEPEDQTVASELPTKEKKLSGLSKPRDQCLLFSDEFDSLDNSVWRHDITLSGGGNFEVQAYINNRTNTFVKDGVFYIRPTLTEVRIGVEAMRNGGVLDVWGSDPGSACTGNYNYGCFRVAGAGGNMLNPIQSGAVRSVNSFKFRYGRVEVRAKMPRGKWIWPAIWMLPAHYQYGGWPASGEIDIVESRGNGPEYEGGGVDKIASTLHWGEFQMTHAEYALKNGRTFADDFHIFTLDWTPHGIKTFVDGDPVLNVPFDNMFKKGNFPSWVNNLWEGSNAAPFDQEFYLMMNVAVAGTAGYFPDGVGNKPWSDRSQHAVNEFYSAKDDWYPSWGPEDGLDRAMAIDYVRVYKHDC
ncbi:hypothetical protein BGW38_004872 [Lunasporangiospora selenospora]|uniref:Sister chromatid cohesion protein n=1 Tax=Lunasporangiospora selenospora TaxID=979761 RepID=A0A9P6G587_9FUNG|nr:hypothetical protein BGW38_004872 [Lunasporangiospora selenospora]